MLWVERAFAGVGVLRELVWGLACPVHCGSSGVPFISLGFLIGFFLGVGLTLAALWTLFHLQLKPSPAAFPFSPSSSGEPSTVRRRSRLQGYLPVDEQWPKGSFT